MYVLGDVCGYGDTTSVLKFDSTQGTWSQVAPMPEERCDFPACAVGSNIFVFGGWNDRSDIRDSVFKYDTVANEWSTLAPTPHACYDHSVCVLDGLVYIVGVGDLGSGGVLRFDPTSGVWNTLASTANRRDEGASFVLGGCMYAAGGRGTEVDSSVEGYDTESDTWMVVANMLEGRYLCRAAITIGSVGPAEEQDIFDALIAKAL
jgi:hypothetical protein